MHRTYRQTGKSKLLNFLGERQNFSLGLFSSYFPVICTVGS